MAKTLKQLKAKNFLGLPAMDIGFTKPVSLFVGRNNSGKSTIRDALEFVLTGRARGVRLAKEAAVLSHNGNAKDMAVELVYEADGEECVLRRKTSTGFKNIDTNPVTPYVLDPMAFIRMGAKARGGVLTQALGSNQERIKKAIHDNIGEVPKELYRDLKAEGVDFLDVDALKKAVVECRKIYKRQIKEVPQAAPNITDWNLAEGFDAADVEKKYRQIALDKAEVHEAIGRAHGTLQRKGQIADSLKKIKAKKHEIRPLPPFGKEVTPEIIAQRRSIIELLDAAVNAKLSSGACECPVCKTLKSPIELVKRNNELSLWLKKYEPRMNEREQIAASNARLEREIEHFESVIKSLNEFEDEPIDTGLDAKLSSYEETEAGYKVWLIDYGRYKDACRSYEESAQRSKDLSVLVTECDRVDKVLADGGPVKEQIAAGGRPLPINKDLCKIWECDLEIKNTGEMSLHGRPIELASASEQYRAGSVVALALAEIADIGFAVMDGFEILTSDKRNDFIDAVTASKINNVLVFVSSVTLPLAKAFPQWLEAYSVNAHTVSRI